MKKAIKMDELLPVVNRLQRLLSEPEPGLMAWHELVDQELKLIIGLHLSGLMDGLRNIRRLLDGSQPKDPAGAVMAIDYILGKLGDEAQAPAAKERDKESDEARQKSLEILRHVRETAPPGKFDEMVKQFGPMLRGGSRLLGKSPLEVVAQFSKDKGMDLVQSAILTAVAIQIELEDGTL